MENKYLNEAIIGNKKMIATFTSKGEMQRVYFPSKDNKQYITFIDPKGIYNLEGGKENPKLQFFERIKDIEEQLNDNSIILNSVIVSGTHYNRIPWKGNWTIEDFKVHNVFFQDDETYIQKIMKVVC